MTAAATTGPARQPRPASSQPASTRSWVKEDFSKGVRIEVCFERCVQSSVINVFFCFSKPRKTVDDPKNNPWTTRSVRDVYDNAWISLSEHQVVNPGGKPGIYGKIHFKNNAIGIVAIDESDNTYLVGQFRYTLNAYSWEIPEGGCPLGTDPLESARRELREETGLTATRWTLLQRIHLSNSVSDEEGFIYLAEDLTPGPSALEDTEADLKVKRLPLKEAIQWVLDGKITDSMSVIGLLHCRERSKAKNR